MNTALKQRTMIPSVPIHTFDPTDRAEWQRMDNNTKALVGKRRFLEMPGTSDATPDLVGRWMSEHGLAPGAAEWTEVTIEPGVPLSVSMT